MPQTQATSQVPRRRRWMPIVGAFFVIVLLGGIIFWFQSYRLSGSVTVLVRELDDTRSLYEFSLASRSLTESADADPNAITTMSSKTFPQPDGSTIQLDDAGVVKVVDGRLASVLIASPVAPLLRTPMTVWNGGERIAWMNPADNSIQVFEKSERGAYVPVYLNTELNVNSLGFTDDGTVLVAARMLADKTELYAMSLKQGRAQLLTTIPGLASVVPAP